MGERKVARLLDATMCKAHGKPGFTLIAPEERQVLVDTLPISANGDPCTCMGVPGDKIWAGAAQVWVGYSEAPVAGVLHITQHNGPTVDGSPGDNGIQVGALAVLVGGNVVIGDIAAATRACKNLAKDPARKGKQQQSANNCGIETMRQIINMKIEKDNAARAAKQPPEPALPMKSEDDMLDDAIRSNYGRYYANFLEEHQPGSFTPERSEQLKMMFTAQQNADKAKAACEESKKTSTGQLTDECIEYAKAQAYVNRSIKEGKYQAPDGKPITNQAEYDAAMAQWEGNAQKFRDKALEHGDPPNLWRSGCGGTTVGARTKTLTDAGVPNEEQEPMFDNLEQAVQNGGGAIVAVDSGKLWGTMDTGFHAVLVTGMEYDESGNPVRVIYNDTGVENGCHSSVDKERFDNAMENRSMNVVQF